MNIAKLFKTLTKKQKATLLKLAMNDTKTGLEKENCPHCKSKSIIKKGKRNNTQSFQCKKCKKNFSLNTKTIFSAMLKRMLLFLVLAVLNWLIYKVAYQ